MSSSFGYGLVVLVFSSVFEERERERNTKKNKSLNLHRHEGGKDLGGEKKETFEIVKQMNK